MNAEKNNGAGMLNSILSGIVLAALTGVGTMQIKSGEKLSDIRAAMMPRDEIEVRLRQMMMDMKSLENSCHANAIAIGELQMELKQTIRARP